MELGALRDAVRQEAAPLTFKEPNGHLAGCSQSRVRMEGGYVSTRRRKTKEALELTRRNLFPPSRPPLGARYQNGARWQGFATPRSKARPCQLRAILICENLRRAAP